MNRPLIGVLCCAASAIAALTLVACDSGSGNTVSGTGAGGDTTSGNGVGNGTTTANGTTTTGTGSTTTTGPGGTTTSTGTGSPGGTEPISDCANGMGSILTANGHQGSWYTYNDMTAAGMQTPKAGDPFMMATPGSAGCMYAANTKGSGFTTWGSGMAFDLNNDGTAKKPFDGSAYTGITFWAMAGADASDMSVQVILMDNYSAPEGMMCQAGVMNMDCNDGPAKTVALTTSWAQYTYAWTDFAQAGYGLKDPGGVVNKAALYAIQFKNGPMTTFDVWVDEVAFTK